MDKQVSLSGLSDELAQVRTKKKEFLSQIERIVPWGEWLTLIRPYYYKGERGNKPYDLERMLRIYLLQNLYDLADEATVAEVIDSRAFSEFCGVDSSNQVPDGDTLGRFRNLLIRNGLQEKLFRQVVELLQQRGLILKKGTIVDSTIIAAPSSTKNQGKQRDPDAHQVKKGNTWHFGYKAHVGVDMDTGLVHTVEVTGANTHDVVMTSRLLTGDEESVYGDSGYLGADKREVASEGIAREGASATGLTAALLKSGRNQPGHRASSSAGSTKSHLFALKWNTYLRSSRVGSDTERHGTGACGSRPLN